MLRASGRLYFFVLSQVSEDLTDEEARSSLRVRARARRSLRCWKQTPAPTLLRFLLSSHFWVLISRRRIDPPSALPATNRSWLSSFRRIGLFLATTASAATGFSLFFFFSLLDSDRVRPRSKAFALRRRKKLLFFLFRLTPAGRPIYRETDSVRFNSGK